MSIRVKTDFRNFNPPPTAGDRVADRIARLERDHPELIAVHVTVEWVQDRSVSGRAYRCRLNTVLRVAGDAWREISDWAMHEDFFIALHSVFDALESRLGQEPVAQSGTQQTLRRTA